MGLMDVLYDLLLTFVEKYDAKRGIPRPVSQPDLTARQAAVRCLSTAAKMFLLCWCGSTGAYLMWVSADLFDVERDTRLILICGMGVVLLLSMAKALQALLPYEREEPPVAQAPSPWPIPRGSDQRALPRNTVPIEDQVNCDSARSRQAIS